MKVKSRSVVSNSLWPHGLYSPWNSPYQNTGVGSHSLLQGIFPTQRSNPGLQHCRWILYQLSHQGSPIWKEGLLFQQEGLPTARWTSKSSAISCLNVRHADEQTWWCTSICIAYHCCSVQVSPYAPVTKSGLSQQLQWDKIWTICPLTHHPNTPTLGPEPKVMTLEHGSHGSHCLISTLLTPAIPTQWIKYFQFRVLGLVVVSNWMSEK